MKCPRCQKEGFKYIEKRIKSKSGTGHKWSDRTSSKCKCNKCGYVGSEYEIEGLTPHTARF